MRAIAAGGRAPLGEARSGGGMRATCGRGARRSSPLAGRTRRPYRPCPSAGRDERCCDGICCWPGPARWPGWVWAARRWRRNPPTRCASSVRDAVPNVDMYFNSQRTGLILAHQALGHAGASRSRRPSRSSRSLATDWKFAEDNSLDLTIRQGVKFHDGSDADAPTTWSTPSTWRPTRSKVATPRTMPGSTRPRRPATSRCASR